MGRVYVGREKVLGTEPVKLKSRVVDTQNTSEYRYAKRFQFYI